MDPEVLRHRPARLHRLQEGNTALLLAAQGRQCAVVERLLVSGADVNHKNKVRHALETVPHAPLFNEIEAWQSVDFARPPRDRKSVV